MESIVRIGVCRILIDNVVAMRPLVFLIIFFVAGVFNLDAKKNVQNESDFFYALSAFDYYTDRGRYDSLLLITGKFYDKSNDNRLSSYAGLYRMQAFLSMSEFDSAKVIMDNLDSLNESSDMPAEWKMMFYNMKGIYHMKYGMDYPESIDCFNSALSYSKSLNDDYNSCVFLCNIVNVYNLREDSAGISYAEEAYGLASRLNDEYLICFSSVPYAAMLIHNDRYDEAYKCLNKASELAEKNNFVNIKSGIYLICGNINFFFKSDYHKAMDYYRKTMDYIEYSDCSTYIRLCYSYGALLYSIGNYTDAGVILRKGLELTEKYGSLEYKAFISQILSSVYEAVGKSDSALVFYKIYNRINDSIFNLKKEQDFNQMNFKYERAVYEKELKESRILVMTVVFIAVLIVLTSTYLFVLYRRRNRMNRSLIERYERVSDMMEGSRSVQETNMLIGQKSGEDGVCDDELSKEKELFDKVYKLVVFGKFYLRNDISLDLIAENLNTNRSYVSKVINKFTGMNFFNYINMLRVKEATRILSDKNDDTPLKMLYCQLGYNSVSAFYRAFQKETGFSPSKYRSNIRKS